MLIYGMVVGRSTFLRHGYERFIFEFLAREFYLIRRIWRKFRRAQQNAWKYAVSFSYRDTLILFLARSLSPSLLPSSSWKQATRFQRTSHGWKQDMEIHLELPSLLYECRRREYLRAIFRHSRTQLCKQVFASGVKESIAATLQRYRSSFSTISDERKFPILRSKFYI